jgi:FkbM family methyltransferase
MSIKDLLSQNKKIKNYIKKLLHFFNLLSFQYRKRNQILNIVAKILPTTYSIDVGASYYPHPAFEVFRKSPNNIWAAIEPNEKNLFYLNDWKWPSKVISFKIGLSHLGGPQTLFVTNIDSGSSLLKPNITSNNLHRIKDKNYFFPYKEVNINTITLNDVFNKINFKQSPFVIKLDTQGTEFSILKGLSEDLIKNYAICVELENTLLLDPLMEGSTPFYEVLEFFQTKGFELVHLKPIQINAPSINKAINTSYILNECDAVFLLSNAATKTRSIDFQLSMLGAYVSYSLYGEAYDLASFIIQNLNTGDNNLKQLNNLIKILKP